VVDRAPEPSLESLAADRGVTICFADLDGADGLWLPEERTILLAHGLSRRRAAEVLEHELSHVDIEDGHTALDADMHRRLGRTRWTVAATAAASLALLAGLQLKSDPRPAADSRQVAPVAVAPSPSVAAPPPALTTAPPTKIILVGGEVRTQTVTVTPTGTPSPSPTPSVGRSVAVPPVTTRPGSPPTSPTVTAGGGPLVTTTPPPTTTDPPVTTLPPSPTAAGTGAGVP
jgi:hypothetical protein